MNHQQTLDYIYSFVDYGLKSRYKYSPETFDLTRMRTLLARLGDPQRRLPAIHVAGTKGKGSVSAMSASILRAAGYKVGLYTSPHLNDFCERLQLDGQPISHEALADLTTELRPFFDTLPGITTFEITTALANVWFVNAGAEFTVFEVGLGGRLDATNVLYPNVCALTSISYDHTQLLGKTLPEIAEEKAGIIKPGVPVVSAPQDPSAMERFTTIARERGARLRVVGTPNAPRHDWVYERDSFSQRGQTFTMEPDPSLLPDLGDWPRTRFDLPLLGLHQIDNAAVAVAVAEELRLQGFHITIDHIHEGLANVSWPGRFEVFPDRAHGKTIVFDCAHNRDSAAKLASTLEEMYPDQRPALIFGSSDDKDISGMLAELLPHVSSVYLAQADHPRASTPAALAETVAASGFALSVNVSHTIKQALAEARASTAPLILITGSIFLVADLRAQLEGVSD
jgi:dihydrofolate synthase / folylpolyglutamate synthase